MYPERQQSTCSISLALVKSAESDLQFEEGKLNNSLMPEINPIKMTSICLEKKSTLASDIPQLIDASCIIICRQGMENILYHPLHIQSVQTAFRILFLEKLQL